MVTIQIRINRWVTQPIASKVAQNLEMIFTTLSTYQNSAHEIYNEYQVMTWYWSWILWVAWSSWEAWYAPGTNFRVLRNNLKILRSFIRNWLFTYLFCYIRVTSHIAHVKYVKESCHICVNESCRVRVNESCHVCLTPMCTLRRWKFSKVSTLTKFAVRKSYKADFWELFTVARPSSWLGRRLWYRCGRKGVFSCHIA